MIEALLKGLTLGFLLSLSVGPVIFSIIKQSLNNGHKGGLAFIIGVSISDIAIVVISNAFTELFTSINEYRQQIGISGSIFLVAVGIYFLFFKKVKVDEGGKQVFKFRKRDYAKIVFSGFLMNTLNPAVLIFWLTTSTAFITHTLNQRIIIFATCLVFVFATDFAKVMLAGKIRNRLTVHNIHIINRLNGLILIAFGIILLWGLIFYQDKIPAAV
jgi:threonine/homoserine/homoserine lactone efflux protein